MMALVASFHLDLFVQLAIAVLLGGGIGLEREIAGKPAGLRTNILICVGAALFMHLSIAVGEVGYSPDGHPYGDVTRIAAQIVTGVGFLGAGTIMQARGTVIGLTSAATIWVVAAIGSAVGAGYYVEALGTTAMVMIVLGGMGWMEQRVRRIRRTADASVRSRPGVSLDVIRDALRAGGIRLISYEIIDHPDDRTFELKLAGPANRFEQVSSQLSRRDDIHQVEIH